MVVGTIDNDDGEKYRQTADNFDHHADMAVQYRVHCPIQGFTRSHWMPPLGECLHHTALAAAMIDDVSVKHKTLTKTTFS